MSNKQRIDLLPKKSSKTYKCVILEAKQQERLKPVENLIVLIVNFKWNLKPILFLLY